MRVRNLRRACSEPYARRALAAVFGIFRPVSREAVAASDDGEGHGRSRRAGPDRAGDPATRAQDRSPPGAAGGRSRPRRPDRRDRDEQPVGARRLPRRRRRTVDRVGPLPRPRAGADHGHDVDSLADRVLEPSDAEAPRDHADRRHDVARLGLPARPPPRQPRADLRQPRLARRVLRDRRRDGGHRARAARAGERRGALRIAAPDAEPGADPAADEGLHLHGGRHRRDADRNARDHDQAGEPADDGRRRANARSRRSSRLRSRSSC